MNKMNILIISTPSPSRTSGVVAHNLYATLKSNENNIRVLCRFYENFDSEDFCSMETYLDVVKKNLKNKINGLKHRFGIVNKKVITNIDYHVQDFNQTIQYYSTKEILKKIKFKPDIIFYLFQQNFLTAQNLYELNQLTGAKIFWYMMDTAPLTGACHYSWDCKGYITGCGRCPALFSNKDKDQSSINFKYKNKYLSKTNIEIIAATEFQRKQALVSGLYSNKPIHKVLLSIDPEVFSFIPKKQAKERLNISPDKRVIFFGGTSINDNRKGMKFLIEAFQILREKFETKGDNLLLLIAGNSDGLFSSLPFEYKYLGLLANNEQLASAYQAADIFACPSIEDAGPMMINQSIMTGTPVVSFEMGVALDLVITSKTGYRAKLKDSFDFAEGINTILKMDDKAFYDMCLNCRELALETYHPDVVKEQFYKLFSGMKNSKSLNSN